MVIEEAVTKVHSLFLATRVDWHDPWIDDDNNAYYLVLFFKDCACYQWNHIGRFILTRLQLNHGYQQVAPCEHRTEINNIMSLK